MVRMNKSSAPGPGDCNRRDRFSMPSLTARGSKSQVCGAYLTGDKMAETTRQDRTALKNRTKLLHAGRRPSEQLGFVNTPVYRGSTVLFPTLEDFYARNARFTYGTQGTP